LKKNKKQKQTFRVTFIWRSDHVYNIYDFDWTIFLVCCTSR